MATLPTADINRIQRGLSRWWSNLREPFTISKTNFNAAVVAADAWVDANAAS